MITTRRSQPRRGLQPFAVASDRSSSGRTPGSPGRRGAFTLIEMLVVVVIIGILASLALSGLAAARKRVRIDRTRSTIRKLHEIIVPQYESYVRRRVPLTPPTLAGSTARAIAERRLVRQRRLVACEMPDSWNDVLTTVSITSCCASGTDAYLATGPVRAYASRLTASSTATLGAAESLFMIVAFGIHEPDVMQQFRADEIADTDRDGEPEFIDAWGRPISWIRWPVGFASPLQTQNAAIQPDPFDPLRVSSSVTFPATSPAQTDYAVIPLIVSAGPDMASADYGIASGTIGQLSLSGASPLLTIRATTGTNAGVITGTAAARDNITNHDLTVK